MSSVIKAIPAENYLVRPFKTHKTQAYDLTYLSGSNPVAVTLDYAVVPPTVALWQFDPAHSAVNPTSGIFRETLYASIKHIFYASASVFNGGAMLPFPSGNLYVFSIAQQAFGETVRPGSVSIVAGGIPRTFTDNSTGGLITAASGSTPVGHVFYELGIAVLPSWVFPLSSGSAVEIEFDATHTIYEHQVICTMDVGEFNYSFNPSLAGTSSFNADGIKVLDKFASGTLTPYFTTIGLYTHDGELVGIGKMPRALKRAIESQQTVIVRFDV